MYNSLVGYLSFSGIPASLIVNGINGTIVTLVLIFLGAAYYVQFIQCFGYYEKMWLKNIFIGGAIGTIFYWFFTPVWPTPYHIAGLMTYALVLFLLGIFYQYPLLRQLAYWCGGCALIYFTFYYMFINVLHPHYWVRLNILFISFIASLIIACIGTYYHARTLTINEQVILPKIFRLGAAFFIYAWLRANIIVWFDPVQQPGLILARIWGDYDDSTALVRTNFTNALLTLYYTTYAVAITGIGLIFKDRWLRYVSLGLACIAVGKLASMIIVIPNTTYRIVACIFVGLLLIACSFVYQKFPTREK